MKIYAKIGLAVLIIIVVNCILSSLSLVEIDLSIMEIFFGVLGAIYAIVAGFVILMVLNNYSDIRNYISSEINALQDLRDYLVYLDNNEKSQKEISKRIKGYVKSIVEKEWPCMSSSAKTQTDTSPELYAIMKSVNTIKPSNQSDVVALQKLVDTIGEITTHRTNRLSSSTDKLPPILVHVLLTLSISLLFIFTLIPISDFVGRVLLNSVNVISISMIYFMIMDLNNPFKGTWIINAEPFQDLSKTI